MIQFYAALLARLGVTEWELRLNSIGDAACRPAYVEQLEAWLDARPELASEEVGHKRATSPLQVFDVKDERLRAALEDAPKIGESLCDACREHFDAVRAYLDAVGVPYVVDPVLVRGLDYYSRTTFEFVGPEENVNSTICGGGRYDGLVEAIGGPPTPGHRLRRRARAADARDRARVAGAAGAARASTSSSPSTAGRASGCSP